MTGADRLVRRLSDAGVRHVFLVPGAHIDPLVEALVDHPDIIPIACTHEQGAAYMADGYARASEGIGVCASIGGPGASNMVTAATTARRERSGVIFITGDVPRAVAGLDAFQAGGQEGCRDAELFQTAAGHTAALADAAGLDGALSEALLRATAQPPAPVHLSIPHDILAAPHAARSDAARLVEAAGDPAAEALGDLARLLNPAQRIAILADGRGCSEDFRRRLQAFAELFGIPVATTLHGKDLLPACHPLNLGNFGYAGSRRAAGVLLSPQLEVLLVLGAALDERNTLCWQPALTPPGRRIIQIDSEPGPVAYPAERLQRVVIDSHEALGLFLERYRQRLWPLVHSAPQRRRWLDDLIAATPPLERPEGWDRDHPVHPGYLVDAMARHLPAETMLCVDSGAHRLFAGHYWRVSKGGRLLTSAITAPLGWAIAAGIGAKLARPGTPVVVLTGDGCLRMHGMELATAARYQASVVFVVSNNSAYGNVYRRQSRKHTAAAALSRLPTIDWVAFAATLGVEGRRVTSAGELEEALRTMRPIRGPFLLDVCTQADYTIPDPHMALSACVATLPLAPAPSHREAT